MLFSENNQAETPADKVFLCFTAPEFENVQKAELAVRKAMWSVFPREQVSRLSVSDREICYQINTGDSHEHFFKMLEELFTVTYEYRPHFVRDGGSANA